LKQGGGTKGREPTKQQKRAATQIHEVAECDRETPGTVKGKSVEEIRRWKRKGKPAEPGTGVTNSIVKRTYVKGEKKDQRENRRVGATTVKQNQRD